MPALLAEPEITAPPVDDRAEPLVPVPSSTAGPGAERPLVRSGVAARLSVAQLLLPPGRRLRVVAGHRRPEDRPACAAPGAHDGGAAVDVTVVDRLGRPVDLGGVPEATPEDGYGACFGDEVVSSTAQEERGLLRRAMTGAGFVGSPTDWRHWSLARTAR